MTVFLGVHDMNNLDGAVKRRVSKVNIDDEHIKSDDELIPKIVNESPSLILDLSKVTWMDEGACKIITWLSKEETICGLVVPQHLEVCPKSFPSKTFSIEEVKENIISNLLLLFCRKLWNLGPDSAN